MRSHSTPLLKFGSLLTLTLLSACAPALSSSDAARIKVLAPQLTGTYDGAGKAGLFKNNYRLLLNIDPRTGRADGVITNTSVNKVYPASGTFIPYDDQGGSLEMRVYDGKRDSGVFKLRLMTDKGGSVNAEGSLKAFLLTYQLTLHKVSNPQPIPRFLPDLPPVQSQAQPTKQQLSGAVTTTTIPQPPITTTTYTTVTTGSSTSQPVYVVPTPGPLPK